MFLNKINQTKIIEKLIWKLLIEILKTLCLCTRPVHSKETNENAERKKILLETIIKLSKVFIQITQLYLYALKLPFEATMFSH